MSPGTLYPMLHALEEAGYLRSTSHIVVGKMRRTYRITARGRKALAAAKVKVTELFGELFEDT
jgi:DNA-binding PadR family transcriptional regulator